MDDATDVMMISFPGGDGVRTTTIAKSMIGAVNCLLLLKGHAWRRLLLTLLSMTSPRPRDHDVPMVVVFGRPGSGKTTIQVGAIESIRQLHDGDDSVTVHPIGLDLDVCVPQWMRDNFAKGIYPTLEERTAVAESACDYVDDRLQQEAKLLAQGRRLGAIVSFSFVNTDLRDIFRGRFPKASWFLMDITEQEANDRILKREGHFYKGKVESATPQQEESTSKSDNDDWQFAPMTFPHTRLDGTKPISENADIVARALLLEFAKH